MATYVLPQVLVFQELELLPAVTENPLRAFIAGGHAQLLRYSDEEERAQIALGDYDSLVETCYPWPNRVAGAEVDPDYTKLFIEDALLLYHTDLIGSGTTVTKLAGFSNKIRSATRNYASNQAGVLVFPRDPVFLDRDVRPGDIAFVRAVVGSDVYELDTYVQDLEGDAIASIIDALFEDPNNPVTIPVATSSLVQIAGPVNCVVAVPDLGYDGVASGFLSETYRILVLESSVGGDFTTAELRVFSGSGTDDQMSVTPAAAGSPTPIGTRGLNVTFDVTGTPACSASAVNDDVPPIDLIASQEAEVAVTQQYFNPQDLPTPSFSSAGTYTGSQATTYIIEFIKGQTAALMVSDPPEFMVTTTNGIDVSGPTVLAAPGLPATFPVGTRGVLLSWDDLMLSGVRKGDKYYITVTPEDEGALRTIVLGHSLNLAIPSGTEVDLRLYIKKPVIQIPEDRIGFSPLVNWEQSATEFCVQSGIAGIFDDSWADNGVPQSLPVKGGDLFVEYRAWRSELCSEINAIHDVAQLDDAISGPLHPDNPLKWGVFKAVSNSNGTEVKFAATCNPSDTDDWLRTLELIDGRDDVYGLVPLTRNQTVLDAFVAHAKGQSDEFNNRWRVVWVNLEGIPEKVIVSQANSTDQDPVLATIEDDPNTSGTQYTLLSVPANNSDFIANGVRPGDIVRTLFTTDGFGNELYTEFEIDSVLTENELRLLVGNPVPISIAQKMEIWRNLTATEEAAAIALRAGSYGDRRVRAVWPDKVGSSDQYDGYHLCAALAGLASGVVPHQGMTRLEIVGFSDLTRTTEKFNKTQLDSMAVAGTWIVTQDFNTGKIFTRHAVTTAEYDNLLEREEVFTRNLDSISFEVFRLFEPFIGISNISPTLIDVARAQLEQLITILENRNAIQRLGPQLVDGTIERLEQHPFNKDRLLVQVRLILPAPLNNVEAHLIAAL